MPKPDLRRALAYVTPYWRRLAVVVVLSMAATAVSLVVPYLSKSLVDVALLGRSPSALFRIVGLYALVTLLQFVFTVASGLRYTRVSAEILFDMRLAVYRHLQRLSPRFFARTPLGQIVSRINADVSEIQRVVSDAALSWIGNVFVLVGTVVMLIVLDFKLFLVGLVSIPPSVWVLVRYRRALETSVADVREHSAGIGSFLIESLRGMRLVVGSNAQAREMARFSSMNDAFVDGLMQMRRVTYLVGGLPGLLVAAGTGIVFLYGGSRVIEGSLTLGTMVAFLAYQSRLMGPVQGLMGLYTSLATARVSLRRVHEILDEPVEVEEAPDARAMERSKGTVELDQVSVSLGRGPVLENVSARIRPGETIAIVGRSGAGKSTIVDLLRRQADPQSGRVLLDDVDLRELKLADVRRQVFAVEQDTFLFHTTIAENVRYVRPEAGDDEIEAALRKAALGDLISSLPDGIETVVGEGGRALSAGERQRIAVARAHLVDPAVLILDEATSSLDAESQRDLIASCRQLMASRTTIIVSHRLELIRGADRALVLENARLVGDDTPDVLLQPGGPLARLFGVAP